IVPVRHHDAATLADVLKKIWPTKADEIYVDPRKNFLIFRDGLEPEHRDILEKLDRPRDEQTKPADATNSLTQLPIVGRMFERTQAIPAGAATSAARDYQQFEAQ